jgi:hypothetical protein
MGIGSHTLCEFWAEKMVIFKSCPRVPKLRMTYEGLDDMFEGDFAEKCAKMSTKHTHRPFYANKMYR